MKKVGRRKRETALRMESHVSKEQMLKYNIETSSTNLSVWIKYKYKVYIKYHIF